MTIKGNVPTRTQAISTPHARIQVEEEKDDKEIQDVSIQQQGPRTDSVSTKTQITCTHHEKWRIQAVEIRIKRDKTTRQHRPRPQPPQKLA